MIPPVFKANDIRGIYPEKIDENFAHALGLALTQIFRPSKVIVGYDVRLSSPSLQNALAAGLSSAQVESAGLCGTEQIYHASDMGEYDLGIMITGSHNPANENGFKIVRSGAIPIGMDGELKTVAETTCSFLQHSPPLPSLQSAPPVNTSLFGCYLDWLLNYTGFGINQKEIKLKPLKIVADVGNGCAGPVLESLAKVLPFDFVIVNGEPDGTFPNGVPNPLLPEKRRFASEAVLKHGADLGVAFDGDFDRCFFFDNNGCFIESYYLIGLLAREILRQNAGARILHDARAYWNTRDQVLQAGGIPIISRSGHARIKKKMREEDCIYGGEMSGHHYFRDFAFCDSGMLPMLLILSSLASQENNLAELVAERQNLFPCSGELNFKTERTADILDLIWNRYSQGAVHTDRLDGINIEHKEWRFNLRVSNTENLLRLNLESRGNKNLLEEKTRELENFIK